MEARKEASQAKTNLGWEERISDPETEIGKFHKNPITAAEDALPQLRSHTSRVTQAPAKLRPRWSPEYNSAVQYSQPQTGPSLRREKRTFFPMPTWQDFWREFNLVTLVCNLWGVIFLLIRSAYGTFVEAEEKERKEREKK